MTYGDNNYGGNAASNAFGSGDFSGIPGAEMGQGVGFPDPNAALAGQDYGYGQEGGYDPNQSLQQFNAEQQSGLPSAGMYGYDASLNQQGSFFQGGVGQGFVPNAPQGQFPPQQFQQPQFQQQGQPQFGQQFPNPVQQEYGQMFGQPQQFQQPQGQPQFQPQGQQGQQPQQQGMTPAQFFGQPNQQFQPQQYGQQPQQPQQFQPQQYTQPQGQGYGQGYYGQPQGYAQPQGYGQGYAQTQPQQQAQPNPLDRYDTEIKTLEEQYAANEVAYSYAQQRNDETQMTQLARERAGINGRLSAMYVQRGNEEISYANQQMLGVQREYEQNMTQLLQSHFGYTPSPQDYQEFQNILGVIMTPQSAQAMRDPMVQQMVLKSYAFDKMSGQRRQGGQRQAPRDYIPNMASGGQNNFGQGQTQNQPFGFGSMSEAQRMSMLTTGRIAPNR